MNHTDEEKSVKPEKPTCLPNVPPPPPPGGAGEACPHGVALHAGYSCGVCDGTASGLRSPERQAQESRFAALERRVDELEGEVRLLRAQPPYQPWL